MFHQTMLSAKLRIRARNAHMKLLIVYKGTLTGDSALPYKSHSESVSHHTNVTSGALGLHNIVIIKNI